MIGWMPLRLAAAAVLAGTVLAPAAAASTYVGVRTVAPVPDGDELFGPATGDQDELGQREPWELRDRLATVDRQVLRPLCEPAGHARAHGLLLNLFPDFAVRAEVDLVTGTDRADTVQWTGEVVDVPDSTVHFTAVGLCGGGGLELAGSVHVNGEEYAVEPRSGGRVVIRELNLLGAGLLQRPSSPATADRQARQDIRPIARRPGAPGQAVPIIDALILYTPGAVRQAGSTHRIEAWIYDAVSRANDNLHESGVRARFRAVAVEEVKSYRGKETVEPTFNHLSNTHDGVLDEAPKLRERFGADIVTTVVAGYNPKTMVAGLASYPENPRARETSDQVWSVVAANQLWAFILAHEWGHLLGLDHDWTTSPEHNRFFPDNHGYVPPDESFVTIMGYPSACHRPCPYIGYYANPRLSHDADKLGLALGHGKQTADNTRVMNITAPQVAAYRAPKTALPGHDLTLSADPPAGGAVTAESHGPYGTKDVVTVDARPAPGYKLTGWTLDGHPAGAHDPFSVRMDRDQTLTAHFVHVGGGPAPHDLAVSSTPKAGGTVTLNVPGPSYREGTQVVATARPAEGYGFAHWLMDGHPAGDDDELTLEMTADHAVAARFVPLQPAKVEVDIRPSPAGSGWVQVSGNRAELVLSAHPYDGYAFSHWERAGKRLGNAPVLALAGGTGAVVPVFTAIARGR